jgi:Uma2 family endonuclease
MPGPITLAADEPRRRSLSVADIERMIEAGIISEDENFELIEGEIIPMGPKSHAHERIKSALFIAMSNSLPRDLWLGVESSIFLSKNTFVEPDICVYPRRLQSTDVKGPDIVLAIEVAASSLAYDLSRKARVYARHGVRELWVIDANTRRTFVHRQPNGEAWSSLVELSSDAILAVAALPGFAITLGSID